MRVLPLGTTTKRRAGEELSEMSDMASAGAIAFSDDARAVRSARLMRHALEYSLLVDRPIVSHAQDAELAEGGVMHEGPIATVLGLQQRRARPKRCRRRDIALAALTAVACTWPT